MSARIAVVSAGAMGAAVGARLTKFGCVVLTNLDGRSEATHKRARDAGMQDVPLVELASQAQYVLSILPPRDAYSFAQRYVDAYRNSNASSGARADTVIFADCNAVNPQTVKRISTLFTGLPITFVDAGIIGGPPSDGYNPTFYASADPEDLDALNKFVGLGEYGLKISPLKGEGAGIGDASALKMSYAGISKGLTGIMTAMILSAHASSPATAQALMHELNSSQNILLQRSTRAIPGMLPKAYRWVGEMEEIAGFVGEGEGEIYKGMAKLYARIERSMEGGTEGGDVDVLKKFAKEAKELLEQDKT